MGLDPARIEYAVNEQHAEQPFSGVIVVREGGEVVFEDAYGYANRAEQVLNQVNTRFGIASGTKLFTGVAVCQLIEQGKLALDARLADVLDDEFPQFDPAITVEHLLTHTSGVPDYFDEEDLDAQGDFGALWHELPVYTITQPRDLLPLFQHEPMKFAPGARFSYSNGGFILLGMMVAAVSGQPYADYVEQHVFKPAGMADAGYFLMNRLPARTAWGYLVDGRTNIFEVPVKGLSDGGVFVTAPDMARFWDALLGHHLVGEQMTAQMLYPHVKVVADSDDDNRHYGYGVWLTVDDGAVSRYYGVGADPGVAFVSAQFVLHDTELTVIGNTDSDAWPIFGAVEELILGD